MKGTYLLLLLFMAAPFQSHSQNLINNKKDTLTYYESFYYSTLIDKKNFKQSLDSGFYVLVFAESVDLEKLKFNINRWNNAPIIYLRHNGFFSFEIREPAVTTFNFNYGGSLNSAGPFANLYRVASPIIGSPCPDFKLKESSGSEIRKDDLLGKVTVLLLWDPKIGKSKIPYQLLNDLAANYQEVNFVALSNVLPSQIKNFKDQHPDSNFKFANDKFQKLGEWTNLMPGNGSVVLIVNKEGLLEYKNIISEDHPIFQKQLENNIRDKLNSLMYE